MTHAEMQELYELYVLGALEFDAAIEIDTHVADGCSHCIENIDRALLVTAELPGLVDAMEPPAAVKQRVMAAITPPAGRKRPAAWLPFLAAAALVCLAFALWSANQLQSTQRRLADIRGERDQLRAAVEVLSRTDTRTVQFGTSEQSAHGRVFVTKNGGYVFVGSELPQIAADRTFELWLIPSKGAPKPAGLFRTNSAGGFVHVGNSDVDVSQIAAVAVSVEPSAGSPAPTTKPILIVPLG